jgi:hypothetical protein
MNFLALHKIQLDVAKQQRRLTAQTTPFVIA